MIDSYTYLFTNSLFNIFDIWHLLSLDKTDVLFDTTYDKKRFPFLRMEKLYPLAITKPSGFILKQ